MHANPHHKPQVHPKEGSEHSSHNTDSIAKVSTKGIKIDSATTDSVLRVLCNPYMALSYRTPFVDEDNFEQFAPPEGSIRRPPPRNNLLIFIVVINIMFVVAIIKISSEREIFSMVNQVMAAGNKTFSYVSQQKTAASGVNLQLLFLSVLILSLGYFLYGDTSFMAMDLIPVIKIVALITLFFVIYLVKMMIHHFMQYLLQVDRLAIIMINNTIVVNFLMLLLAFPLFLINYLNFGLISAEQLNITLLILFVISLIYRILRQSQGLMPVFHYPAMYLLLYICTLEVLPWLLVFFYFNN
ncbi:MAG: DUF4271 domain-containing protein [Bacteroidota bacterium]|nr:DUF4271 domain-containing protein [Bacteroidota bacterium]